MRHPFCEQPVKFTCRSHDYSKTKVLSKNTKFTYRITTLYLYFKVEGLIHHICVSVWWPIGWLSSTPVPPMIAISVPLRPLGLSFLFSPFCRPCLSSCGQTWSWWHYHAVCKNNVSSAVRVLGRQEVLLNAMMEPSALTLKRYFAPIRSASNARLSSYLPSPEIPSGGI